MVGVNLYRQLIKASFFWLPLFGAAFLAFGMLTEARTGIVALESAGLAPAMITIEKTEQSWFRKSGLGRQAGGTAMVRIILPSNNHSIQPGDIVTAYGRKGIDPVFIHSDLVNKYRASPDLAGLAITPEFLAYGMASLWCALFAYCFQIFVARKRYRAGCWTADSPELREIRDEAASLYENHPLLYRAKVVSAGFLGLIFFPTLLILLVLSLGYILFILVLSLPATSIQADIALPALILSASLTLLAVARLIQSSLPKTTGVPLPPGDTPALEQMIQESCLKTGNKPIKNLLITGDYQLEFLPLGSAGFWPVPRFTLVIGLPLLQSLSPLEFQSALIGELARHNQHGNRLGAWLYRWQQIFQHMRARKKNDKAFADAILRPFLDQFAPSFNALARFLVTEQIQTADKVAVKETGPDATAQSITSTYVSHKQYETVFWDDFYRRSYQNRYPKELPYDISSRFFASKAVRKHMAELAGGKIPQPRGHIEFAFRDLRGRLRDLRLHPQIPDRLNLSADKSLLGDAEPGIRDALNMIWWQQSQPVWDACHSHYRTLSERQKELDTLYEDGQLTEEQWLEWADIARYLDGWDAAADIYETMLIQFPRNPEANYTAGWFRLHDRNLSGLQMLEIAIEETPALSIDICADAVELLEEMDDSALLGIWRQKLQHEKANFRLDLAERGRLLDSDILIEHDLGSQEMKDLIQAIAKIPEVEQAFLARKQITARPDSPLYVLGVNGPNSKWPSFGHDAVSALRGKLDLQFEAFVVPLNNKFKKLQRQFETMEHALIFNRSGRAHHNTGEGHT
ncbi:hypothetical protein [Aestuariispira insulae]|uniref:Zn-dependent protease with chaperone function n=1 Tax=Aestuariispira insulae TaxID=1461337 RepID=A0A3D9HWE6_9PROT|nr:hypothetical protein [Aestuariispira insulae]RED53822.1 hypothetical protein DFP90_101621 [Aestuariispira insulae]